MTSREIREKTGLSRAAFSRKYHIPLRTLENWDYDINKCPQYVLRWLMRCVNSDVSNDDNSHLLDSNMTISDIRNKTEMSVEDFAHEYGIPARTVVEWEAGRRHCPVYVSEWLQRCVLYDEKIKFYICLSNPKTGKRHVFASFDEYGAALDALPKYTESLLNGDYDDELGLISENERNKAKKYLSIDLLQRHELI